MIMHDVIVAFNCSISSLENLQRESLLALALNGQWMFEQNRKQFGRNGVFCPSYQWGPAISQEQSVHPTTCRLFWGFCSVDNKVHIFSLNDKPFLTSVCKKKLPFLVISHDDGHVSKCFLLSVDFARAGSSVGAASSPPATWQLQHHLPVLSQESLHCLQKGAKRPRTLPRLWRLRVPERRMLQTAGYLWMRFGEVSAQAETAPACVWLLF